MRLRRRQGRVEQQRILIDGVREVGRAIQAGVDFQGLFVSDKFFEREDFHSYTDQIEAQGAPIMVMSDKLLERISYGDRSDGIVALATPPRLDLNQLTLPPTPLLAILERVEKPGNLGAVIRTAAAAGLDAVILVDSPTDPYNPNAIRSSLGTIFDMSVASATCDEVIRWLAEAQHQVAVARVDGAESYDRVNYRLGTAFVLGSEAMGVSSTWKQDPYIGVRIPMSGKADSLNVSATAAVLFYEANRHRRDIAANQGSRTPE